MCAHLPPWKFFFGSKDLPRIFSAGPGFPDHLTPDDIPDEFDASRRLHNTAHR